MPSPFPGMDPYLEAPGLWPDIHHRLITYLSDALNAALPARYVARVGERLVVVQHERSIYPDVAVAERPRVPAADGAAAVCVEEDPPLVVTHEAEEVRQPFLDIRRVDLPGHVVTTVEVLSPANKAAGSASRAQYLAKQEEMLRSRTSLLEIDLHRQGLHTVAVGQGPLAAHGPWQYAVCLHRGGQGGRFEVWRFGLTRRLPRVRVPLAGDDADLIVDLHALLTRCYDDGRCGLEIDYGGPPAVPLPPADAAWADALLRERGLRP